MPFDLKKIFPSFKTCDIFGALTQICSIGRTTETETGTSLDMKGVSVFHMQSILAAEVAKFDGYTYPTAERKAHFVEATSDATQNEDLDANINDLEENTDTRQGSSTGKTIYQLEDLRKGPGLIRRKGIDVRCPRDGKMGAAYVDCLKGKQHVGRANLMLSYSWGNTFTEILDVLEFYCEKTKKDPKKVYVWICCLCNNQHRVVENLQNGFAVEFEEFETNFRSKVLGIGNVLALLCPWDGPKYLTRVWCIFELFTANKSPDELCTLYIDMPKNARDNLLEFLFQTDDADSVSKKLHEVLGNTAIQNAEASIETDKENILKLVQMEGGGYEDLNNDVNDLLRDWFHDILKEIYDELKLTIDTIIIKNLAESDSVQNTMAVNLNTSDGRVKVKNCLDNLCAVFQSYRDFTTALNCVNTNYEFCKKCYGEEDVMTSAPLNDLINIYRAEGQFNDAIKCGKKCLVIKERIYGTNHINTAISYYNIGRVYSDIKDFESTLEYYNKVLSIYVDQLGENHERTATAYHSIGFVHHKMHDSDQALDMYKKAVDIKHEISKSNNGIKPSLATSYNSIGVIYGKKGEHQKSLNFYFKALNIRENILGEEHPSTRLSYKNIMTTYRKLGNVEKANEYKDKMIADDSKRI